MGRVKRSRFSEEQIIAILKEQEAEMTTASALTFCVGMEVSEAQRLRAIEDENAKLNKLLAEAMLDNVVLKDLASKNGNARH